MEDHTNLPDREGRVQRFQCATIYRIGPHEWHHEATTITIELGRLDDDDEGDGLALPARVPMDVELWH
jgi:hypothetical protein